MVVFGLENGEIERTNRVDKAKVKDKDKDYRC